MTYEELQSQLRNAEKAEAHGNYDEAERLSHEILTTLSSPTVSEATESKSISIQAGATRLLGVVSWHRGDFPQAMEYLHAALHQSQVINDQEGMADALGRIGLVHNDLSDYPKALECYGKALSIEENLDNKSGVAIHLGNMGTVHSNLSDYPKALEYHNRALSIDDEIDNRSGGAVHLSNIGTVHARLSNYPKALEYYGKALRIAEELGNTSNVASTLGNIGNVYQSLSDYPRALEYHSKALSIAEELGNMSSVAINLGNIGMVHNALSDYSKALEYYGKALSVAQELGNKSGIAANFGNIGIVHRNLYDYPKALDYLSKTLGIYEELGRKLEVGLCLGNIGLVHLDLSDYPKALEYCNKALSIAEELGNKSGGAVWLFNIGIVHKELSDYVKAQQHYERALSLQEELGNRGEAISTKASLGALYAIVTNPNHDDAKAEAYLHESIALSQELGTKEYTAHQSLAELYERQERWQEANQEWKLYHTLKEEVQSDEAKKSATLMEQKKQIAEREKEIAIAKATAEAQMSATTKLLYKVLPQRIATRIIDGEEEIADYFTSVSILFADIAGFTPISADMPAIVVVRFLNYVFGEFDRIMKKHGCEKIKTIGDGYMAVAGAPLECADHAERLAAAALEMQETINLPESIREYMPSGVKLGVRIGLHTGSVVAGVIGEERFVYDIYSDAVNTAARMESHGEENKIHCSNDFYRHLQNRFAVTKDTTHGFVFEKRGEMEIKGKGIMRTYFLERV